MNNLDSRENDLFIIKNRELIQYIKKHQNRSTSFDVQPQFTDTLIHLVCLWNKLCGWLVGFLWLINLCRVFNA